MHHRRVIFVLPCLALAGTTIALMLADSRSTAQPLVPSPVILMTMQPPPSPPVAVTTSHLRGTLIRLGLDSAALAAAGVQPAAVETVIEDLQDELSGGLGALVSADQNIGDLAQAVAELEQRVRSGTSGEGDLADLASARADLATATAARSGALNSIHEAALTHLSSDQRLRLQALRTNAAWEIPAPYRVVTRSESDWVRLRAALAHERWAQEHDVDVDPSVQALLASVRAEQAVASAISHTATNVASIASAWNSATDL